MSTYTVQPGDSLSKIATKLGLNSWKELEAANQDLLRGNPHFIRPGWKLQLPEKAGSERAAGASTFTASAQSTGSSRPAITVPAGQEKETVIEKVVTELQSAANSGRLPPEQVVPVLVERLRALNAPPAQIADIAMAAATQTLQSAQERPVNEQSALLTAMTPPLKSLLQDTGLPLQHRASIVGLMATEFLADSKPTETKLAEVDHAVNQVAQAARNAQAAAQGDEREALQEVETRAQNTQVQLRQHLTGQAAAPESAPAAPQDMGAIQQEIVAALGLSGSPSLSALRAALQSNQDPKVKAQVSDAIARYVTAADLAADEKQLKFGIELLRAIPKGEEDPRLLNEYKLASAHLAFADGAAEKAAPVFRELERSLSAIEKPTPAQRQQLRRAILGSVSTLEALAIGGPKDERVAHANELRDLRIKYTARTDGLVAGSQLLEMGFSEARAFVKVDPLEAVATLKALKAIPDKPQWAALRPEVEERLKAFDEKTKDSALVAGAQALLSEAMDVSFADSMKVAAGGFVVGAGLGALSGGAAGTLLGPAGTGAGALVGAIKGGFTGAAISTISHHVYRGFAGRQRAWAAAETGYSAETLKDSLWDGVQAALVVVGTPLTAKGLSAATQVTVREIQLARQLASKGAREFAVLTAKLTGDDIARIVPEGGAIPGQLAEFAARAEQLAVKNGHFDGFAGAAKTLPKEIRLLADASSLKLSAADAARLGDPVADLNAALTKRLEKLGRGASSEMQQRAYNASVKEVAKKWEQIHPTIKPHPSDPRYLVIERSKNSPHSVPEIDIRVKPGSELDPLGVSGRRPDYLEPVGTPKTPALWYPKPENLIADGKPLRNYDGVAVLMTHGSTGSVGLSNGMTAQLVAEQIAAAQKTGKSIDKLVLIACNQRNLNWGWKGGKFATAGSNGARFQQELNTALHSLGGREVKVLTAENPGTLLAQSWSATAQRYNTATAAKLNTHVPELARDVAVIGGMLGAKPVVPVAAVASAHVLASAATLSVNEISRRKMNANSFPEAEAKPDKE